MFFTVEFSSLHRTTLQSPHSEECSANWLLFIAKEYIHCLNSLDLFACSPNAGLFNISSLGYFEDAVSSILVEVSLWTHAFIFLQKHLGVTSGIQERCLLVPSSRSIRTVICSRSGRSCTRRSMVIKEHSVPKVPVCKLQGSSVKCDLFHVAFNKVYRV